MKFFIAIIAFAEAAKDAHLNGPMPERLVETQAKSHATQMCLDSGWVDSYGDGCDWYDSYPSGCGGYDTSLGSAYDECCACGGGTTCSDPWVDSYGDGCEWYVDYPSGCGGYDTDCGSAYDECPACYCDTTSWVDNWGDGCDWYDEYPSGCGYYDEGTGGSAFDACCACIF